MPCRDREKQGKETELHDGLRLLQVFIFRMGIDLKLILCGELV